MRDAANLLAVRFPVMRARTIITRFTPAELSLEALADEARHAPVVEKRSHLAPAIFFGEAEQSGPTLAAKDARTRTALALDVEQREERGEKGAPVPADFLSRLEGLPYALLAYGSPSYTSEFPRWRVVVPTRRPLSPEETIRCTGWLIDRLGATEWTDPVSVQPSRRYYAPIIGAGNPEAGQLAETGLPVFLHHGSALFAPDDVPDDWSPEAPEFRGGGRVAVTGRHRQDPRGIDGPYGDFNRAFSLEDVIELSADWDCGRLPYEEDRPRAWRWLGAANDGADEPGAPSLTQINPDVPLYHDHATSSPHGGRTLCAFDLAASWFCGPLAARDGRVDLDAGRSEDLPPAKRASTKAFAEWVQSQPDLMARITGMRPAPLDPGSSPASAAPRPSAAAIAPSPGDGGVWSVERINSDPNGLTNRDSNGSRKFDNMSDVDFLVAHDPVLRSAVTDARTGARGWRQELPGRAVDPQRVSFCRAHGYYPLTDADEPAIRAYVSRQYSKRAISRDAGHRIFEECFEHAPRVDAFRDYLESLPQWDGVSRLERFHPGVRDSELDRSAARKFLVALVKRTFEPGCEMGWMPIFIGAPETFKSSTLRWLVRDRYTEIFSLETPHVMESIVEEPLTIWDEFHLYRSERDPQVDLVKSVITRTSDTWRRNYARTHTVSPRMWVMAATANSLELPSMDGLRRFVPIHVDSAGGERNADGGPAWRTDELRDQLLAEAVHAYRAGESIVFSEAPLRRLQAESVAEEQGDSPVKVSLLRLLNLRLPGNWCGLLADTRRKWLENPMMAGEAPSTDLVRLPFFTPDILLEDGLGIRGRYGRVERVEIKRVMQQLGWHWSKRQVSGSSVNVWVRPDEPGADSPAVLEATALTAEAAAHA